MASMLTGDRRWGSRKSSMTVLGKVPKPINLPSQRSENHGLDPTVEIVPKGTITWGSQPSTNVWGLSALLSPKTDGSSGSPSHVNGSSGTRPSTAGSDRSHEPAFNAWGPNSRPSSASGTLTSSHTSTAASRPRSAETRPSSSQLSRFAESPVESTVPWGGAASSSTTKFSLNSGDFPTLGYDKNSESELQRGHCFHGRPGSASGSAATQKETPRPLSSGGKNISAYPDHGNVNSWKADDYPPVGGGPPPNMHPYPAANIPPQRFGPWINPQVYPPDAVWNSGGAAGGHYRPAGPPGSYPVDPYAYYPPQFPVRPPPNPDAVTRPGSGPGGYNPKNVESYHHHQTPDPHMVPTHYPSIPVRPGVYPNPGPYDGYYGPPPPYVYDQLLSQSANVEPGKFHARPSGSISVITQEQKESQQPQYKVLLKQHDGRGDKNGAHEMREESVVSSPPDLDRGILPGAAVHEEDWRRNRRNDERAVIVKSVADKEASFQHASNCKDNASNPVVTNMLGSPRKETGDSVRRKSDNANFPVQDVLQNAVLKKKAPLIEKIEGLNSKVRIADGHKGQEEKIQHYKVATKADHSVEVLSTDIISSKPAPISGTMSFASDKLDTSTDNINQKSHHKKKIVVRPSESNTTILNRSDSLEVSEKAHSQVHQRAYVARGKVDEHATSNRQDHDGSKKNSVGRDTISSDVRSLDSHPSQGATEESHHVANSAAPSYAPSSLDSTDHKADRAKLKEKAMQRAKELQQQEEERIREQKAKALAKLDELNKRTSAQSSNQKTHDVIEVQPKESTAGAVAKADGATIATPGPFPAQGSDSLMQASECEIKKTAESNNLFVGMDPLVPISVTQESETTHDPSLLVGQESISVETTFIMSPNLRDDSVTKRKQTGSRRRPNISQEENQTEKLKTANVVPVPVSSSDTLPGIAETLAQPRKKNNRNARNKGKLDETLANLTVPSNAASEVGQPQADGVKIKILASVGEATLDPAQSSSESTVNQGSITSSIQRQSQPTEKMHGMVSNQWKPQPSRKSSRNQQATRPADKFHGSEAVVWAPVKSSNKNEPSEELSRRSNSDTSNHSKGKNGNDPQHVTKTKRAELERYVPKPVVKEMSQQDSWQETPSLDPPTDNMVEKLDVRLKTSETHGPEELALGKPESSTGGKNGEFNKPNRRGKTRTSWRQRGSAESLSTLHGSIVGGVPSDYTKPVMASDQNQPPVDQHQQIQSDEWGSSNDNRLPTEEFTKPVDYGSNYAPAVNKDFLSGEDDKGNESDRRNALRSKNQSSGGGELRSQWQPKYQPDPRTIRNEIRGHGGQRFASQGAQFHKELCAKATENYSLIEEEANSIWARDEGDTEWQNAGHQDNNRGKRAIMDQTKEHMHSAKDFLTEVAPANVSFQQEQPPVSSAQRRQGHHNNRFNRRQHANFRGDRDIGRDAGQQMPHMNEDKQQKGNSHAGVGAYNRSRYSGRQNPVTDEEIREDSSRAPGMRYKERGQNYSRRGDHFYGQRAAAVEFGE